MGISVHKFFSDKLNKKRRTSFLGEYLEIYLEKAFNLIPKHENERDKHFLWTPEFILMFNKVTVRIWKSSQESQNLSNSRRIIKFLGIILYKSLERDEKRWKREKQARTKKSFN